MSASRKNQSTQIQYHGEPGITKPCLEAILRLIQFGDRITNAALLSCGRSHCFLLTINYGDRVAIKAGFASGYSGEGPKGLAAALQILERHGTDIEEYVVKESTITAVDESSLTMLQLQELDELRPLRPKRWFDYVYAVEGDRSIHLDHRRLNDNFPPVLPYAILDPRIVDLAITFFGNPDASLISAYRRLEDAVREKSGLSTEGSARLFAKAFQGDDSVLHWNGVDQNQQKARASLFDAVYRAYRNPRSHRELANDLHVETREFLLLNELFVLESSSTKRNMTNLVAQAQN